MYICSRIVFYISLWLKALKSLFSPMSSEAIFSPYFIKQNFYRSGFWQIILSFWDMNLYQNCSSKMFLWQSHPKADRKIDEITATTTTKFICKNCFFIDWHLNPKDIWFYFPQIGWMKSVNLNSSKSNILYFIWQTRGWFLWQDTKLAA